MKGKKFLAGVLSAAMVLGTMALPVFADETGTASPDWDGNSTATVFAYGTNAEGNFTLYADTLTDALKQVYMKVPTGTTTIECKPNANVGSMQHGHVADNLIINGNDAYVSGGEYDLEIDTYTFDRTTGTNTASTTPELSGEITVKVNNLNKIAAWGQRRSDATINLEFTDCEDMNRVYFSGNTGTTNITINNCSFSDRTGGSSSNTSIYSNAKGEIALDNVSFANVAVPINLKNKSDGTQTIIVKNCQFTNCATAEIANNTSSTLYAAPIRVVTEGSAIASNVTVKNCSFTNSATAGNGTILLGDGRDGENSTPNVKLNILGTAAEIQVQEPGKRTTPTVKKSVTAADNAVVEMPAIAKINDKKYYTLKDAIAAAQDGDTVELLSDASGNGVVVPNNSNLTIDFNGFTYNIDGTTVGSSGTETNGFQLLKGSNITFKDGTITSEKAKILIQNYSNLTLENVTLDGSNLPGSNRYVLSNNCGNTVLKGNTNIIAKEGDVAFDCFYWPNGGYSEGVTVTLGEDFTGKIYGAIEKTHDNSVTDEEAASNQSISISGGTFTTDVSAYCVDGFSPKLVNGKYVVDNSADTLKLTFKKHTDDERVYDIVLNGDGKDINRLNAAEFKFELSNAAMTYEIKAADKLTTLQPDADKYVFYFDGKDAINNADSGREITIGTVTFDGFGVFTFKATAGKATATTTTDNLVTEFVTTAEAGKGTLKIGEDDNMIKDAEIKVPTQKLTVNVAMEHNVGDNTEAYQDMTVAISGGDLAGNVLEYKLGDAANTAITKAMNGAMVASYQIEADLTKDRIYTVTVSGAGYRTSRYTVTMTEDKTMNFWNNDKTNEVTVIDDEKAKTTFLAGELVRDGKIDIYDLSAVVAYFGQKNIDKTQASKFAKYDLNRDGEIDIMDISIVLTSWGK